MATSKELTSTPEPSPAPPWLVSVPLSDLQALMEAAREVPALKHEIERCHAQLDAFRVTQCELMNKYQELYKLL